ncbi:hypothetical protein [Massilia sp. YIM B02443]|uniref:hypothetical protein n=1 Tax=Massilia sp. YIM B02443 TaxID=3050127 RepID=UPI0025B64A09|nr:hypothetical protein [Massilia sp. YIM B02443]MDN4038674.1 hypothetical protein [Massilia sp. YIM B02443]
MKKLTAVLSSAVLAIIVVFAGIFIWKFEDWIKIPKAREAIQSALRDPSSAQFRNEKLTKLGVLCGEVNSKNSMGGYVGFKKFISVAPGANYIEGAGRIGEESTDDMIARMDKEIVIMKRFTAAEFEHPSKDQITEFAVAEIFRDKWAELCEES